MNLFRKISLLLSFALIANFSFATEGTRKNSEIQPEQQQGEKKQNPDELDPAGELEGGSEPIEVQSVDSTEDESVSKYNFIFYFLYKLKYDENQEAANEELY